MQNLALILFLLCTSQIYSQSKKIEQILAQTAKVIDKVNTTDKEGIIYLPSNFAENSLAKQNIATKLKDKTITKVEYIYTSYSFSPDFDQKKLNKERLEKLYKEIPELFSNNLIEWNILEQNGCIDTTICKSFFHGFKIWYRPEYSEETLKAELDYIKSILEGSTVTSEESVPEAISSSDIFETEVSTLVNNTTIETLDTAIYNIVYYAYVSNSDANKAGRPKYRGGEQVLRNHLNERIKYPEAAIETSTIGTTSATFTINIDNSISNIRLSKSISKECDAEIKRVINTLNLWEAGQTHGKAKEMDVSINFSFSAFSITRTPYLSREYSKSISKETDSTVLKIFNRNKQWNKMLIVCDFTGSMSPYTSQLLLWHKLNYETNKSKIGQYTFFNDGDSKSTNEKKIGSTDGIYHSEALAFEDITNLAYETMRKGNGGDCPENNIEAVIKGLKKCNTCKDVVLIADNFATPRDLELAYKIEKPIKIILCGTYGGVNVEYINLAKATGGSIHTIEDDITNLALLNEGETITINKQKYKMQNGKFLHISDL